MNRDRVIRYIDGQMSPEEKSYFEEELKNSLSLHNELEDCRKLLKKFHEVKDVSVEEDYFTNLLPEFRKKISSGRKFMAYPVLGYGLVSIIIIVFFSIIILRNSDEVPQTEDVVSSLSDNETEYILNNYSDTDMSLEIATNNSENYDSVLTNLLAENLVSDNPDLNYIIESSEGNFYNVMTESQAEIIYNELINKKFF
jgi:hypothetical protein